MTAGSCRLDVETLDSFYAELRRCREHCDGRLHLQHRTGQPHVCRGLADSTVRQIHWILSGALDRGVVWQWISVNPAEHADKPPLPHPDPRPPTAEEAARLVERAWSTDPDWGALVWLTMTTGARRGEICGLRWSNPDLDHAMITIRRTVYLEDHGQLQHKDTKTHQQRRVVLDPETAAVLREHRIRAEHQAAAIDGQLDPACYVFSGDPGSRTPLNSEGVTQRYKRMAASIGVDTTLKNLRHYSATELVSAGVDVRTVAHRLGHGGGGATTLRVYTACTAEADQRAARTVSGRMPARPAAPTTRTGRTIEDIRKGQPMTKARTVCPRSESVSGPHQRTRDRTGTAASFSGSPSGPLM